MGIAMKVMDTGHVELLGTNLIEASAGTGKTYAITTLFLRALLERELDVEQILVVTYTRAATSELRDRIAKRLTQAIEVLDGATTTEDSVLGDIVARRKQRGATTSDSKRLKLALRRFDQAAIFTIHGFCQRCLQDRVFEQGRSFEGEFDTDDRALANEIAEDYWARETFDMSDGFFSFMQSNGFALADLKQLSSKVIGGEELAIVPREGDEFAGAEAEIMEEFRSRYQAAQKCWTEDREEVIELLVTSPQLKQTSYKPKQICDNYVPAVDALFGMETGTLISDDHKAIRLSAKVLRVQTKKKHIPPKHQFFDLLEQLLDVNAQLKVAFDSSLLAAKRHFIGYVRSESKRRKFASNTISFDDLLARLRDALFDTTRGKSTAEGLRTKYPIALIDEFQDTDPMQYEVFRRIYHRGGAENSVSALFLIGDPKQAIYGFRGADLFTYFRAREDAGERVFTLDTNYRSSPAMIAGVNGLFGNVKNGFLFDELEFTHVKPAPDADNVLSGWSGQGALQLLFLERRDESGRDLTKRDSKGKPRGLAKKRGNQLCTQYVAGEIVNLLTCGAAIDGQPVVPGDIAVLVRKNWQALEMQEVLLGRGVPSVLESDTSVFTTTEAEELDRVLIALCNPTDRNAVKSALATGILGFSGNDLSALADNDMDWDVCLGDFARWNDTWLNKGFIQAFFQLLRERKIGEQLLRRHAGERKMSNIRQLGELLQAQALATGCGPQTLCSWFTTMRTDSSARSLLGDVAQIRLETDAETVKIVTVHKSKGLEYPVVFCLNAWDGKLQHSSDKKWVRFHDPDNDQRLSLDIGSEAQEENLALAGREALAEDLRLLYVAVTRAKHHCFVACGGIASFGTSGLAYVLLGGGEQGTDAAHLRQFAETIAAMEDETLRQRLAARTSSSHMSMRPLRPFAGQEYQASKVDNGALKSRSAEFLRAMVHQRVSSYSGLIQGGRGVSADVNTTARQEHSAHSEGKVILADVPKGAQFGLMFHHLLEHVDFYGLDGAVLQAQVEQSLSSFGFSVDRWTQSLVDAMQEILQTALGPTTVCLADISKQQRIDELEFCFPLRHRNEQSGMSPAMLAEALASRKVSVWPPGYLESLQNLTFTPLSGFLKGYIDTVFVHDERWYVVDYKSNFLGPNREDYQTECLREAMAEHHYFLQYHIYTIALHRYLQARMPGYDYERNFGGVFYLFLRGMAPTADGGAGVFFDRPNFADVSALNDMFL